MLDATTIKAQIDAFVTAANDLETLKAAPTVTTYGAARAAYDTVVAEFDNLTSAMLTFQSDGQSAVRLT